MKLAKVTPFGKKSATKSYTVVSVDAAVDWSGFDCIVDSAPCCRG
jgi:hypothetical protein